MCVSKRNAHFLFLLLCNRKLYYKRYVVRLNFGFRRRFIALYSPALCAFMGDDIALFFFFFGGNRDHKPPAAARAVAGVVIEMKRAETARTVIAARIAERLNVKSAVCTDEFLVLFFKKFCFHCRIIQCR